MLEVETDHQKILWTTKFSAGRSLLPAYNFLAIMAYLSFVGCGLPKILAIENIPRITVMRLGSARWVAVMAILPDNPTHVV